MIQDKHRVLSFKKWLPIYVGCTEEQIERAQRPDFDKPFASWAQREIVRIRDTQECRYCNTKMSEVKINDGYNRLFCCHNCGYFGGDGARHQMVGHLSRGLVALGEELPLNSPELSTDELIRHLNSIPNHLLKLSPFRAEKVVMELLQDYLGCEVRPVGGVKDQGVDGYIVANDQLKTIIQVKWYKSKHKAESVSVVREIAGTLLARGVPHGLLVTTRHKISADAKREIDLIEQRRIAELGKIKIDVNTYNDLIDMLELASTKLGNTEYFLELLHEAAWHSGFDTIHGRITEAGTPDMKKTKQNWGQGHMGW